MTNMIDWLRATGEWMHKDRPDIYPDPTQAMLRLEEWVQVMREQGESGCIETGGHSLVYHIEEGGVEEWTLNKKIATCELFFEEGVANAFSWVEDSGTMTAGPNLPTVAELDFLLDLDNDE